VRLRSHPSELLRTAITATTAAVALVALAAGCADSQSTAPRTEKLILVPIAPIAEMANEIKGPQTAVKTLVGTGVEPHDLELTAAQIADVEDADLVVYLRGLIPQLDKAVANRKGPSIDLLTTIPTIRVGGVVDPHVWLDPTNMRTMTDAIAHSIESLGSIDTTKHVQLISELTKLDQEFKRGLTTCKRRELITAHESFGYLAGRYGLTQIAVSGLSPEAEPNPNRFAELTDIIKRTGSTTVFAEHELNNDVADALAREANVKVAVLSPMETMPKGSTYASIMRANLAAIRAALDCT
jgi:zinc transport system substrate-binding protein